MSTPTAGDGAPYLEPDPNMLPEGSYAVVELPDRNPWDRGRRGNRRGWGAPGWMGFGEANRSVWLGNYATFSGRASRSEYWWAMLALNMVLTAAMAPAGWYLFTVYRQAVNAYDLAASGVATSEQVAGPPGWVLLAAAVGSLIYLLALIPWLAVSVRRLHDTDHSGWWLLLPLLSPVPIVGAVASIWYFVLTVLPGTPGANRFG